MPSTDTQLCPLLEASRITKVYRSAQWPSTKFEVAAIKDISLRLPPKSTLALVGKSGSGKSTLARCLARLETPDAGEIFFQGRDMLSLRGKELKRVRRDLQLIFQHSATAMNPRLTAREIIAEPLRIQGIATQERQERAFAIMKKLRIPEEWAGRYPHAFSGGQRQRLVLARALILNPRMLILDEALSGLDLPAQMQIAKLLRQLQDELSLAYFFISHDLPMAAFLADNIAVMDHGKIVESGIAAQIYSDPQSAATRELVASTPALARETRNASRAG